MSLAEATFDSVVAFIVYMVELELDELMHAEVTLHCCIAVGTEGCCLDWGGHIGLCD